MLQERSSPSSCAICANSGSTGGASKVPAPAEYVGKGGHSQRIRVKAPARVAEKEEQAFEASVSI